MKFAILAMTLGSALAEFKCPTNMAMTFVNMANKVISTVTIKPNENGQYIMNSTCHGGNPAHGHAVDAHGNPAQGSVMNMADCSFDTHWLVPGQAPKLNRNFVFADELVVPGGIQWRVGIQSVDPNVATYTYPHLANYPLNEAVQIEEADFVAKPGADCSFVGNRKLVVADMGHQFHSFQMIFKGKDLTIKGWDTLQKGGPMKGWSMDTTFDIKTCTAMVNLAPALPGPGIGGRGLNSIRKLTVSTKHIHGRAVPSFELTDPSGKSAPHHVPTLGKKMINIYQWPTDRWVSISPLLAKPTPPPPGPVPQCISKFGACPRSITRSLRCCPGAFCMPGTNVCMPHMANSTTAIVV